MNRYRRFKTSEDCYSIVLVRYDEETGEPLNLVHTHIDAESETALRCEIASIAAAEAFDVLTFKDFQKVRA